MFLVIVEYSHSNAMLHSFSNEEMAKLFVELVTNTIGVVSVYLTDESKQHMWPTDLMKVVTKDEFFAALSADKRDIMPSLSGSTWSEEIGYKAKWKDWRGNIFGVTYGRECNNNCRYLLKHNTL